MTPTLPATQDCPSPCHTLNQYAQNTSLFARHINISMVFLNGVHNLNSSLSISLTESNNSVLEFQGLGGTVIIMSPSALIDLSDITHLNLVNFQVNQHQQIYGAKPTISCKNIQDLTMDTTNFQVVSPLFQLNVHISSSQKVSILDCRFSAGIYIKKATKMLFQRMDLHNGISIYKANNVTIQDSTFSGASVHHDIIKITEASSVLIQRINVSEIERNAAIRLYMVKNVAIKDSIMSGGLTWVVVVDISSVLIQRVEVYDMVECALSLRTVGKLTIQDSTISQGEIGVFIDGKQTNSSVEIQRTLVSNMDNKALYFLEVRKVVIFDSMINSNGIGLSSMPKKDLEYLKCKNCTFSSNKNSGLVLINSPSGTLLDDCRFYANQGSSITLYSSTIKLRGETIFRDNNPEIGGGLAMFDSEMVFGLRSITKLINNTAQTGGGLALFNSRMILKEAKVMFKNNTANEHGGAIYINALPSLLNEKGENIAGEECFYKTNDANSLITFTNNQARLGGLDIHGVTLYADECSVKNRLFQFENTSTSLQISSAPTRVCFCINNVPQCENRNYLMLNETRYPGETFTASVVLTGYNLGRVAGSVYANVLGRDYKEVIREMQHVQTVELMECTNISYTVSSRDSAVLVLTTKDESMMEKDETFIHAAVNKVDHWECPRFRTGYPCPALLTTTIFISVALKTCPLGFELSEVDGMCKCDQGLRRIEDIHLTCEIQDHMGYINREKAMWVGVDTSENNTDIYYWHRYCPRDYCIHNQTSINLLSPDEQCSPNRTGVLCGRCQDGYSLQLGGNKCIKCNNSYLILLIVFAVLGILLVVLIKLLDLTVTSGTVSGLIFYSNVVWRNNAILFFLQDRQSIGYYVVTLPIAWINLDFGIETCFTENLDQLTKTGLQFVFPVYIWCIAGLIIIVCHYSTRATKLLGNNSVAVLATLFLLSYGKLFRNITDVFTYADITDSNGTTRKVWSLDGNVQYGATPGPIILMVVAFIFFVLFLLPFTLTLLLVPFLRAKSHHWPLQWINSLKPFYDTYYGPFKDKKQHQVWTGILLISRVVILIVYATTSTYSPDGNVKFMAVKATLLLLYSAMVSLLYKKWSTSLIENIYIVNLAILGGTFTLQNKQSINVLSPVPTASLVIALFTTVCTVIGHTIKRIMSTKTIKTCLERKEKALEETVKQNQEVDQQVEELRPTVQIIEIKKYDPTVLRETLLDASYV